MTDSVKYMPYSLTLSAPAIVTTLAGDPNSATTQMFVPGNAVRGALAARLLKDGLSTESDEFRSLILSGRVHYLHAYPARGSTRSLPTPIGWRCKKGRACDTAVDLAAFTAAVDDDTSWTETDGEVTIDPEDVWPAAPLDRKGMRPFATFAGSTIIGVQSHRDARMHQQRDREAGRSWTKRENDREISHGTPFVYEYLRPTQSFRGMIRVIGHSEAEVHALVNKIRSSLDGQTILVGRSLRAGYGGAASVAFGEEQLHEADWGDVQQNDVPAGGMFRAYLLSACVVRDPSTGQFDPCALSGIIEQRLGGPDFVRVERVISDFETVGGFNRKWRLETPQASAVKAGSCFVLRALRTVPLARLREVADAGLGERRVEGFGRLAFLQGLGSRQVRVEHDDEKSAAKAATPDGSVPDLVCFLQQRVLDAAVSRALDRKVAETVGNKTKPPTASLLGRLRIPLRSGNPEDGLNTLRQWLRDSNANDRAALKKDARDKLAECRLAKNISLRQWLIDKASDEAGAEWATSAAHGGQQIGARELLEQVAKERGAYYAVRLIDAVLAALARMARQDEREDR